MWFARLRDTFATCRSRSATAACRVSSASRWAEGWTSSAGRTRPRDPPARDATLRRFESARRRHRPTLRRFKSARRRHRPRAAGGDRELVGDPDGPGRRSGVHGTEATGTAAPRPVSLPHTAARTGAATMGGWVGSVASGRTVLAHAAGAAPGDERSRPEARRTEPAAAALRPPTPPLRDGARATATRCQLSDTTTAGGRGDRVLGPASAGTRLRAPARSGHRGARPRAPEFEGSKGSKSARMVSWIPSRKVSIDRGMAVGPVVVGHYL